MDTPHDPTDRPPPPVNARGRGKGRPNPRANEVTAGYLAVGMSVLAAAKKARVDERTVRRWLADPTYRAKVDQLRTEVVGRALKIISGTMTAAAKELRRLLRSEDESTRLRAVRAVFELGVRLQDSADLARQVAEQGAELDELRQLLVAAQQSAPLPGRRRY